MARKTKELTPEEKAVRDICKRFNLNFDELFLFVDSYRGTNIFTKNIAKKIGKDTMEISTFKCVMRYIPENNLYVAWPWRGHEGQSTYSINRESLKKDEDEIRKEIKGEEKPKIHLVPCKGRISQGGNYCILVFTPDCLQDFIGRFIIGTEWEKTGRISL